MQSRMKELYRKGAANRLASSLAGAASSADLLFKVCGFSESIARRDDSG
ncbi:MAG: hypothetical protein ABSF90_32210 [Syntrophobacteraceae bacterium]|jgi:hypothetical protein